ncbi:serine incorporator 2 isoform X2 [Balaenoptera acutorostrata]|uniref:Serine incorporator 2 isoform X2 n=1 Tax=Balaenoptera acutorostrata TaxID=9767 RepID=A0ABM3UD70_BALAC|nr:serine incorporator 2 isoform X2 [Balaenoptera acutorostrata]
MGACLGACSLLSCASCLCGSAPCILCSCCPCSHSSTLSRLIFTAFLFLGVLVSVIMLSPGVKGQLYKLPWVCEEAAGSPVVLQGHVDCGSLLGHRAVYRMCFAMAAFFFLFTLLMTCVRSSRDPRAAIQNGFWFFKFLVFVGITVGAFYIPDGSFSDIWFYFGVAGSFVFLLVQLLLLIDFAHSWNQRWLNKAEKSDSRAWYAGCPAQLGSAAGLGHHALHHVCHLVGLIQCPRPEMQPQPADPLWQWDGPGRPRGLRDPVVGCTEHRGPHRLHPVHPLHQSALLGPPAGKQPDADGGVPACAGSHAAAAGGGLRGPGLRQRAGQRHLQLLLLPLLPGARLSACHDDAHQLVQTRRHPEDDQHVDRRVGEDLCQLGRAASLPVDPGSPPPPAQP